MSDVFISYSRKDKIFVQQLHEALKRAEQDAWVDWKDIPLTADWWAEIQEGIEAANTFVFVISPDSINSTVCAQEVDHAAKHNKRIVPLLHREAGNIPETLGKLNWVYCREYDDFDQSFTNLLQTMNTDLEWVKAHTRLTRRAVEWDKKAQNESYLLRGDDLLEAERWQARANLSPRLTQLQQDYILTSRQKQDADQQQALRQAQALAETERQRAEEQTRYAARIRRQGFAIIGALVGVILLGFWGFTSSSQISTYKVGTESFVAAIVEEGDAHANSDICWAGAMYRLHGEVLPACNQAVALEPDNWYHYESRGIILGILDEYEEAKADFEQAITLARQAGETPERILLWQSWIADLDRGEKPFDHETMKRLRETRRTSAESGH